MENKIKNQDETAQLGDKIKKASVPSLKEGPVDKTQYSITIGVKPEVLFAFWRDFQNLSLFMKDLEEVRVLSDKKSHWVVKLKNDFKVEWDAEVTGEIPGQMISWHSVGDSEVKTKGTVWFIKAPADLGTQVRLTMNYEVPGGKLTEFLTKLMGEDPDTLANVNLKRLKAFMETGEIPTTEGQPSGRDDDAKPIPSTTH